MVGAKEHPTGSFLTTTLLLSTRKPTDSTSHQRMNPRKLFSTRAMNLIRVFRRSQAYPTRFCPVQGVERLPITHGDEPKVPPV
jgi:hypothetical protein